MCVMAGAPLLGQQSAPAATPVVSGKPNPALNGLWDYNDTLSVDASTGQREQAPLSGGRYGRRRRHGPGQRRDDGRGRRRERNDGHDHRRRPCHGRIRRIGR